MNSVPKASRFSRELQAHMVGVVGRHFAAQRLRLRREWEPRVGGARLLGTL